jgi:hypothetical protein
LNDGTKVNPANRREINDRMKQTIKRFNNPIDLDGKSITNNQPVSSSIQPLIYGSDIHILVVEK